MITLIISAYGEPKATKRAVEAVLNQKGIKEEIKIIVSDPFPEVEEFIKREFKDNKNVKFILDFDEGKSAALNLLLEEIYTDNKNDIIISTDGDVHISPNAISAILKEFKDPQIGLVCGHPVTTNSRKNKYGFWSHLLFNEMNKTRKQLSNANEFFELSGYLFAMRNGIIKSFPTKGSEDNVIPHLISKKGYKLRYSEEAEVYVLNPQNYKDWIVQKKRNIKGHIAIKDTVNHHQKRKNTIFQEAIRGLKILNYPKSIKEYFWTAQLFLARLHIWSSAYYEVYIKKQKYKDGWRETETPTTKPLD